MKRLAHPCGNPDSYWGWAFPRRNSGLLLARPSAVQCRARPAVLRLSGNPSSKCWTDTPIGRMQRPTWGGGSLALGDGLSRSPSAWLAGLGRPWKTLVPQGLIIDCNTGRRALAGNYRFALTGGTTPTLQFELLEGALQMNGNGQWTTSLWRFDSIATIAPGREAALSNLLDIIGLRRGNRSIIMMGQSS